MTTNTLKILKTIADAGDLSLPEALASTTKKYNDHRDQYPLASLIEEDYLGITIKYTPPNGAESMRVYGQAINLHMFTLKKNENGEVKYNGIISSGSIKPEDEKVFIKTKGLLYLDEQKEKRLDRIISFILCFLSAFLGFFVAVAAQIISSQ